MDNKFEQRKPTKLETILDERGLSQGDLVRMIEAKSGFRMGRDRISKICTGKLENFTVKTAVMIAEALGVPAQDIIEMKDVKGTNLR